MNFRYEKKYIYFLLQIFNDIKLDLSSKKEEYNANLTTDITINLYQFIEIRQ